MSMNPPQLERGNMADSKTATPSGVAQTAAARRSTTIAGDRIGRRKMRIASINRHYTTRVVIKEEKMDSDSTVGPVPVPEPAPKQPAADAIKVKVENDSETEETVLQSADPPVESAPSAEQHEEQLLTSANAPQVTDSVAVNETAESVPIETDETMEGQPPPPTPSRDTNDIVLLTDCESAMSLSDNDDSPTIIAVTSTVTRRENGESKPELICIDYTRSKRPEYDAPNGGDGYSQEYQRALLYEAARNMVTQQKVKAEEASVPEVEQIIYEANNFDTNYVPPKQPGDEDRKIFIGGLSFDTSECDLEKYFSRYGTVDGVSLKYNTETGISRRFAFVSFTDEAAVKRVLKKPVHVINGRWTEPRRAKSRPIYKKVFVGGIDSSMTEADIREYFSRFGKVIQVDIPVDRTSGLRRHFCFVMFQTEEAAEEAALWPRQMLKNRMLDVRRTSPNSQLSQQRRVAQAAGLDITDSEHECNYKIQKTSYQIAKMNETARIMTASAAMAAAALATPIASFMPHSVPGMMVPTGPQMSLTANGALVPLADHINSASMAGLAVAKQPNAYPAASNFSANCFAANHCCCHGQHFPPATYAMQVATPMIPYSPAPSFMPPACPVCPMQHYAPMSAASQASIPSSSVAMSSSGLQASAMTAYHGCQTNCNSAAHSCSSSSSYFTNTNQSNAMYLAALQAPPPPPPLPPSSESNTGQSSAISGASIIPNNATAEAAAAASTSTITASAHHYTVSNG